MSRITNSQYLRICHVLTKAWQDSIGDYADYSVADQRIIHDYFRPSEDLTDEQRLAHRAAISKQRPSLPANAGRALRRRYQPALVTSARAGKGTSNITVRPVIRPQPDMKLFADALLLLAQHYIDEGIDPKTGKKR